MAQKIIRSSLSLANSNFISKRCLTPPFIEPLWRRSSSQSVQRNVPKEESPLLLSEEDREDFFRVNNLFTVEDLYNARVHFGHKETMLNPHMRRHIFGKRLGVLIIDLDDTAKYLKTALNVTAEIAYREGIILFVNRSRQTGYMVEEAAKECGEYAYCKPWRDDVFTNARATFGTVIRLPDLVVFFNTMIEFNTPHRGVDISAKMLIPTVGIVDTNSDPSLVTWRVPGNDDTPQSIELYCNLFKKAVLNGKSKRLEIMEKYGSEFYYKTLEVCQEGDLLAPLS